MEQVAELNSQLVIARSHITQAKALHKDIVDHAFGHAQGGRDNLLGDVLNTVDMNVFGRYVSHREN